MTFETETSRPPESLPLPSQGAVFPEDSTLSQPDSHPLPPGETAQGEGSPSTDPLTPDPRPAEGGTPDSLSPLSAHDLSFLATYTELNFNPTSLAEHFKISIFEAVTWINSPHIRPHLREVRRAFTVSAALSAAKFRLTIADALEDIIKTTDDLVEKRRAATTLLKAITPPRRPAKNFHSTGTPTNLSPTSPSSSRSSCPSCSTSSPSESKSASSAKSAAIDSLLALLNKDGTINRNRLTDIADDIDRENEKALDTESDEDNEDADDEGDDEDTESDDEDSDEYSESSASSAFSSPRPLTPDPRPLTPPDPSLHPQHDQLEGPNLSYTPDQVVDRLMHVLHTRTEIEAGPLGIARNFLSKESPLFRPTFHEIAQQLMDFSIIDLQASKTWEYLESTQDGNTATRQVQTTDRTCGPKRVFLFTLTRAGPESPWLLHDIKFHSGAPIKILPNPYRPNNTS